MVQPGSLLFLCIGVLTLIFFAIPVFWPGNKVNGLWYVSVPVLFVAFFAVYFHDIIGGNPQRFLLSWVPSLNVNLSFYLDGLALFFVLLITGIGCLVFLYAAGYIEAGKRSKFYAYLIFFMLSMIGIVVADNLVLIYLFWELTSVSSFLLIGFKHQEKEARDSALQALLVTGIGGLSILAGLLMLGSWLGTFEMSEIIQLSPDQSDPRFVSSLLLIAFGAFTKSAQYPFQFWLPDAMAAPTPVSAYLHSSTMVKAGIYLLARLASVYGSSSAWLYILGAVGGITMILSAFTALSRPDLKRKLAFLTISALGMMVMMIGFGGKEAIKGLVLFIIAHGFYKASLFMMAGNMDHETGTRNILKLGGLKKKMPANFLVAIMACLSLAAFPFTAGFVAKETMLLSLLYANWFGQVILILFILVASFFVAASIELVLKLFLGDKVRHPETPKEKKHLLLWIPALILAFSGLIAGVFPESMLQKITEATTNSILQQSFTIHLKAWHGFNTELLISLITLVLGTIIYFLLLNNRKMYKGSYSLSGNFYPAFQRSLDRISLAITNYFQSGILRYHLVYLLLSLLILSAFIWTKSAFWVAIDWPEFGEFSWFSSVLVIVIIIMTLAIFRVVSRLTLFAITSLVGFSIASLFLVYSAPDLSITQLLVETLTLIIFLMILHRLPDFKIQQRRTKRPLYLAVSIMFGLLMTLSILSFKSRKADSVLKEYFIENAETKGKGKNIVNVILVDFRAFDTMGEVTVLSISALGVFVLLRKEKNL